MFKILEATGDDYRGIVSIIAKRVEWLHERGLDQQWGIDYVKKFDEDYYAKECRGGAVVLVAKDRDGRVWGSLLLKFSDKLWPAETYENSVFIHHFATDPENKDKTMGRALLARAAEIGRERGRDFVRLDCMADNLKLCEYYEKLGFTRAKFRPTIEEYPSGYRPALYEVRVGALLENIV